MLVVVLGVIFVRCWLKAKLYLVFQQVQNKKLSAESLSQTYRLKGHIATDGEHLADTMIENAFTIWSRALCLPEVFNLVTSLDEYFGMKSPCSTVQLMSNIITKGKSKDAILWLFQAVHDLFLNGQLKRSDLPCGKLAQDKKGVLDLLLYKREVNGHFKTLVIPSLGLMPDVSHKIMSTFENCRSFRTVFGYDDGSGAVVKLKLMAASAAKLHWMGGWPQSAKHLVNLIESCVYKTEVDSILLKASRNRKSPNELLNLPGIQEQYRELIDISNAEKAPRQ